MLRQQNCIRQPKIPQTNNKKFHEIRLKSSFLWRRKIHTLSTYNTPLSAALGPRPTQQIRNRAHMRFKYLRIPSALNIQAH